MALSLSVFDVAALGFFLSVFFPRSLTFFNFFFLSHVARTIVPPRTEWETSVRG